MKPSRLSYLWQVSHGQRGRILLSCLIGILGVGFALAFIYTSKRMIDIATGAHAGNLAAAAIATAALLLMQLLCNAADTWVNARMEVETANALRHRLFSRLLRSRWNTMEQLHTGDVVNRVEQDTTAIVTLLTTSLPAAVVTVVQLVGGFLFFFLLDPVLPWLVAGILPVFLVGARFYMRRMRHFTHDIRRSDSRIQSVIQESLQYRTVIKTLEQDEQRIHRLGTLQDVLRTQVLSRTRFSLSARMAVSTAFAGGYVTALIWGAVRLSTGSITVGTLTAFLQLVGRIQRPAFDLSRLIPNTVNALTAADRLLELKHLPAEVEGDGLRFERTPVLRIENLHFAYPGAEAPVFSGLTHCFAPGSYTAVVGETGRGKTTLVRLLLALAEPQSGSITLAEPDGGEPVEVSARTRGNFVYVPQGNTLFSGTVRDNLLMGNPDATPAQLNEALHTAVALDFVRALPQGIDTPLGEQGGGLSEGQAQRIALARALLRPGRILLLDEATSALDPETERILIARLRQRAQGKTVIFVTHHAAVVQECEEQIVLNENNKQGAVYN